MVNSGYSVSYLPTLNSFYDQKIDYQEFERRFTDLVTQSLNNESCNNNIKVSQF